MEVAGPLGTPLGLAQRKRASPRGEAVTSGFLSVSDSDRRVPAPESLGLGAALKGEGRKQIANENVLYHSSESESHSVMSDSLRPRGLYSPWNSPGQNTGVGSLSLLQGIFPTQGWNLGLPNCRQVFYQLSHQGMLLNALWGPEWESPKGTPRIYGVYMWQWICMRVCVWLIHFAIQWKLTQLKQLYSNKN